VEEGYHDDMDEAAGDDVARGKTPRVQFADDVDQSTGTDASTSVKDDLLLQPRTTDDGYLTPTTRTTADDSDLSYLHVLDSPTNAAATFL